MGKAYRETVRFLKDSQYWSAHMVEAYQLQHIQSILFHAYSTVPYYRQKFDELDFDPTTIKSLADFHKNIPFLTREDLASNYDSLKSTSYGLLKSYEGMTGGTTGASVRVLFSLESNFIEWGYMHALWSRVGYSPNHRRVALIGTPFQGNRRMTICLNPYHNELQLSVLHLDEPTMAEYVKSMKKFSPSFLYGFPSAWMVFGTFLNKENQIPKGIKAILCGSEQMTDDQRLFLESTFGCPVYSWYGQTEKVALAGECEHSYDYHLFFEYGYTELINEKGDVIQDAGQLGEIVATGFINHAMPLIRYRTGDMAEYAKGSCPCGRSYRRLSHLVGRRKSEYLIGSDGTKIPLSAIDTQLYSFRNVRQSQFFQSKPGRVQLNILATPDITEKDITDIRNELSGQLAGRLMIDVALVQDLVRTTMGKVKPCVQNVVKEAGGL